MFADRVEEFFVEAKKDDRPFYLTMGYVDLHRVPASRGGFGNVDGNYDARLEDCIFSRIEVEVSQFVQDLPAVRQELAEYYRPIHRMDQGIGLVLEAVERQGLADETLVLFER
ncbi:hypothetical protein J3459_015997 [Metarhizium acridum]|uniref:uncharacterized protein n=1 Tax=Metarhizium acridum TaxID=92637 RepID=UPI001C6B6E98|nr:hypothetical protein J3458_020317 [Metarhizium acridum]KAG8412083.1 hypothetical protein J3459_016025 [Metarhizium acridum]KAG8412114.1 hypothetical protein J3459_015997 [Metarhizium acridum]